MALPTITRGDKGTAAVISNATDVAGFINITPTGTTVLQSVLATLTYGRSYATAPIVVFSQDRAQNPNQNIKAFISGTTTGFSLCVSEITSVYLNGFITFAYHVIETQSSNASSPFSITTGGAATSSSITNGTDVAGNFSITPRIIFIGGNDAATITFGRAYAVKPIVIVSPSNVNSAIDNLNYFVSSTTTGFTLSLNNIPTSTNPQSFTYHIIETQSSNASAPFLASNNNYIGSITSAVTTSNGTDVAGTLNCLIKGAQFSPNGIQLAFGKNYTNAYVPVICAANRNACKSMINGLVPYTDTSNPPKLDLQFIQVSADTSALSVSYNYHIFETQ